jgi:Endonuclease/Exonuclease/phosphatase family
MKRTSMRPSVLLSLLVFLGIACGGGARDAASLASPVSASAVDPGNAGGNKFVTVMTRNLFIGGDVFAPLTAPDPLSAALTLWTDVQASDYAGRAADIAGEIVSKNPDLVGLQEAYRWTVLPLAGGDPVQELDFLENLMTALAERGADYRAVVVEPETDITLPFEAMGVAIRMLDRDVILARGDVAVLATDGGHFSTLIPTQYIGPLPVNILRGWTSVEVTHQGVAFRFLNTHMDGDDVLPIQFAQAYEIVNTLLAPAPMATIVTGDTNVIADKPENPEYPVYTLLTSTLRDAWMALDNGPNTGYTCCFADIRDPDATLDQRVDLVLLGGALTPEDMSLTGTVFDVSKGLWPSDHLGVVAYIRLENPKFFALKQ